MVENWDVVVVGAGPAGSTAARLLAGEGKSVLLLDRSFFPRRKSCGGALPTPAARFLPFPFDAFPTARIDEAHLRVWRLPCAVQRLENPVHVADRARFDALLLSAAVAAGAVFRRARALRPVRIPGGWEVKIEDLPPVRCRYLLCCDGSGSSFSACFRRHIDFDTVPALSVECRFERPPVSPGAAVLELKYVPFGYSWLFPMPGGKWNYGMVGPAPAEMYKGHERIPADVCPEAVPLDVEPAWAALRLFRPTEAPLGEDTAFLCGEAGALVDPLLGEGIRYALESAHLAVAAVLAGGDAEDYTRAVQAKMRAELSCAWKLADRYRKMPAPLLLALVTVRRGRRFLGLVARLLSGEIGYSEVYRRYKGDE